MFAKLEFRSRAVNFVAASAFAVYLLHTNVLLSGEFKRIVREIYAAESGPLCCGEILLFLCFVFALSVLIDQARKLLWKGILRTVRFWCSVVSGR